MSYQMGQGDRIPLTDEMIQKIVQLVEAGNYMGTACAAVGVHRSTFMKWKQYGERVAGRLERSGQDVDPDEYPQSILPAEVDPYEWQCYKLFWALETSEAQAEATAVLLIRKQMPQQWTAAMTFLERRFPDRWRKRQTFEQVVIEGSAIDEQAVIEDPEAVRMLHDALERVQRGELDVIEQEASLNSEGLPKLEQAKLLEKGKEKGSQD